METPRHTAVWGCVAVAIVAWVLTEGIRVDSYVGAHSRIESIRASRTFQPGVGGRSLMILGPT